MKIHELFVKPINRSINGVITVRAGVDESLNYLIQNTFPKLGYLKHPSKDPQKEIRAVLAAPANDGLGFHGIRRKHQSAS